MRLTPDQASRIKACEGVYGLRDTARYFNVSPTTVHSVWHGRTHTDVSAALELPNVITTRVSPETIVDEGRTLLERGMNLQEAADKIGVGKTTLYNHMKAAPLMVFA